MDWFEALILGIIQGLTEFLPISSTGHLLLGRKLFGLEDAGLLLDSLLHIGTLVAVVTVYWQELKSIVRKPFSRITWLLVAGTLPTVIIGLAFKDFFEEISKTGITVGWEFLATGCILWLADTMKKKGHKTLQQITTMDALIIGSFQGAAILPALSRSGLTIAAALFRKIDKATAAYFSFLLSIPAIAGGCVLQLKDLFFQRSEHLSFSALFIGTLASALFGYVAVKWMISLLKKGSLKGFAVYVWALGAFILLLQGIHVF
ncbi:undecaprenyl pyrophosphate phosphatase [Fictibacillus macauensis ZFHKF-1]|uniref:Undecaprenyl-diphosphatase n=1 Tax=Fictibacillus macauensis ZFHKF-1 TaxID=1196324 RepID=I8AJ25_9BACL|nr:undecaprenyl-diphosphate phosphatase [Fictibacillus macauensis]EIT85787.1 undecaprenyl pyrophosphate phosphatase [Fictibacillus macauensis ZFHKF-1]